MANDNAPQCGKCSRMMENYDYTNANSRDCTCDKCHFLLAGYSCPYASCKYMIHKSQDSLTSIYDYTNSTCSKCYCDIDNCGLLLAGYIVYGCLPCRYAVHKVCPKGAGQQQQPPPLRNEVINGAVRGTVSGVIGCIFSGLLAASGASSN
uniref:Phorbol-ester/DAG-type domain-containing protein n=1 Tax=Oryza glumipatula TaxID=40148 RepID=A0A0E0A686_9ORYZ